MCCLKHTTPQFSPQKVTGCVKSAPEEGKNVYADPLYSLGKYSE